ncbi:MAG: low temperature requirement protein A [Micromonosporaceae bacterium]|nr:low temperature requirement protein A [Micromonosporaceae bacterium]
MSSGSARWTPPRLKPVAPGAKATWLELFYDLVFAFAFIRVTLTASVSPESLLRAMLLISLLWFLWITFSTLGNFVRGDEGVMPPATIISVGATFIAALVLPSAYGSGKHPADYLFALCYLLVRGLQVLVYWERVRRDPPLRPRWPFLIGPPALGSALLLVAAFIPYFVARHVFVVRAVLLGLTVAGAYAISVIFGFRELERIATRHWADRYAQILLIALGESIIAVGTARRPSQVLPPTWPLLSSAVLGLVIITTMAFTYFDHHMVAGEHALREARGRRQTAIARDAYVFIHLPMIIGILLFSLGLNDVHLAVQNPAAPAAGHPSAQSVSLLYGGICLYGAALLGFQRRTGQQIRWFEIASWPPLLLAIPAVALLPSMYALLLLAAYVVASTALKHLKNIPERMRIRAASRERERTVEAAIRAHERAVRAAEAHQRSADATWPDGHGG